MLKNPWNHPALLVTVCLSCLASTAGAAQVKQNDWGQPKVKVLRKDGKWVIEGLKNSVSLNPSDLQMSVTGRGNAWAMAASFQSDLVLENATAAMSPRLADAGSKEISPYRTGFKAGLKITLADFTHKDTKFDLQLSLFVCLESQRDELICELVPAEKSTTILECCWPKPARRTCRSIPENINYPRCEQRVPCTSGSRCSK